MALYETDSITTAIGMTFTTANELTEGGEPANVVDALFAIARALDRLADATFAAQQLPARATSPTGS